jgi:hypothetical protein
MPALRASDLPHWPYTAESARPPITVIGKVRRKTCSARPGRGRGHPAVLPVLEPGSGGGRSRLLPSNKAPTSRRPSPMWGESIACYRDLSPAVPPVPGRGKRARREAVIGPYPDVLVPNEPPTGRLLQGDDLPGRCRFWSISPSEIVQSGPITAARTPCFRRRHAPLTRALRPAAGGQIPRRWAHRQARVRERLLYVQIA